MNRVLNDYTRKISRLQHVSQYSRGENVKRSNEGGLNSPGYAIVYIYIWIYTGHISGEQ